MEAEVSAMLPRTVKGVGVVVVLVVGVGVAVVLDELVAGGAAGVSAFSLLEHPASVRVVAVASVQVRSLKLNVPITS